MKVQLWAGVLALSAAPVLAQPMAASGSQGPGGAASQTQARFPVRVMESVLESAVQQGAQTLSVEMRKVSPDLTLFSGPARARGFHLEGYGVFFAVDVPALHRSLTWSVRTLAQSSGDVTRALQLIRRIVQAQNDPRMRNDLEQALRLVELQVGPPALPSQGPRAARERSSGSDRATAAATPVSASDMPSSTPLGLDQPSAVMVNPDAAYTAAVQNAIVSAMLDYGHTLNLGPDEWLTVAARENSGSTFGGDLTELVTITLRVRGATLEAIPEGRLSRDDARRLVEIRQF